MAHKVMQILIKAFLLLAVILIAWVGLNQIESEPLKEITAISADDGDWIRQKPDWPNEFFRFVQDFDQMQTPVPLATLEKYRKLIIANNDYPTIRPLLAITSFFSHRFALNRETLNSFSGLSVDEQLAYMEASLKLSQNLLNQKIAFIQFSVELAIVNSIAKYLDETPERYKLQSSTSAHRYQTIKKLLAEIADARLIATKNALVGELESQLALSKNFKLSDLGLEEKKGGLSLTIWDQIGFLFYNQGATQNTIYENFQELIAAAECVQDFSCEKKCLSDACPEIPKKTTGSLFLNPMGLYLTKFMTLEPRLLVKASFRFKEIKATAESLN
ncbi:hypothetical protein AZI86_09955 [Bdellovibrio bacteriovorus]|uniref:Uncharacterized protein n=1 Tax=Bdellovibrio bacteriovorus TaxID=959 RepID=A0A150WS22_BDEBC|nr:hypothetical protein [Bdellovibrio bacteriovorus]KYG67311.1 hypothetical protein AZI86_09955 [Bdellovibrio bacteriovorus]